MDRMKLVLMACGLGAVGIVIAAAVILIRTDDDAADAEGDVAAVVAPSQSDNESNESADDNLGGESDAGAEGGSGGAGEPSARVKTELDAIPKPDGALYVSAVSSRGADTGQLEFTLRRTRTDEAVAYYQRELASRGWSLLESNVSTSDAKDDGTQVVIAIALFKRGNTLLRVEARPSHVASGWSDVRLLVDASPAHDLLAPTAAP